MHILYQLCQVVLNNERVIEDHLKLQWPMVEWTAVSHFEVD